MKQHKIEHYIFNFNEGSKAEIDIEAISFYAGKML